MPVQLFANALILATMLDDVPGSVDDMDMLSTLADARDAAIANNASFLTTPVRTIWYIFRARRMFNAGIGHDPQTTPARLCHL